jgi:hypothetical protein
MPQKRRSGYIPGTIFTSLGDLVFGLGLVVIEKVDRFSYSYLAKIKICSLTSEKVNNTETLVGILRAKPEGTPKGKRLCVTDYPELSPNRDKL